MYLDNGIDVANLSKISNEALTTLHENPNRRVWTMSWLDRIMRLAFDIQTRCP